MSIEKRRFHEKEEMREKILDASTKIINEEGYDKLSMRKIAEIINYSPTTIYIYYKNKAQIAEDLGRKIYEKIVGDITEILIRYSKLSIEEQLRYSAIQFINSMVSDPEMGKAFISSGSRSMFAMEDEDGESILVNLLIEGNRRGVLRNVDENTPGMIITSLIGFGMNAIGNQLYLLNNWEQLVKSYVDMILYGLIGR